VYGQGRLVPHSSQEPLFMSATLKSLFSAGVLLAASVSAQAYQSETIHNKKGEAVFELRIYGTQDGSYSIDDPVNGPRSVFDLDDNAHAKIRGALSRWAEIVSLKPGHVPAIINIGTVGGQDARAGTTVTPDPDSAGSLYLLLPQAALLNKLDSDQLKHPLAEVVVGTIDFDTAALRPSQLPLNAQADYAAVMFHEFGHTMGMIGVAVDAWGLGSDTPYIRPVLTSWAQGLRDDNGNAARPEQAVLCSMCNNAYDPDAFDLRKDQGYFTGQHVQEVLDGAMPGIPVRILSYRRGQPIGVDTDYMGHSELRNSLMSQQSYRNYTNMMEAELASLQDMGLQIDRRNFYGYSVYGDGLTLTSNNGFFARNSEGTAYLPGQYNQATQGVGLHIYGERNT